MRIIFLYAEMVPSWVPTFEILVNKYGASITVVYWDHKVKTPYRPVDSPGVKYVPRSEVTLDELKKIVVQDEVRSIFVSGWMDIGYLLALYQTRAKRAKTLVGLDDWWFGTFRQRAGSMLIRLIKRSVFDYAWIPGPRQYEYARRMGFKDNQVVYNMLSADEAHYLRMPVKHGVNEGSTLSTPSFLYVGRFSPEKGVQDLVSAYKYYKTELGGRWELKCVGNGPLQYEVECIQEYSGRVYPFSSSEEIFNLIARSSVVVIPSRRDYSPLVVHEAALSGKPLLISENVGNRYTYLIHGYNGRLHKAHNPVDLAHNMLEFENMSSHELKEMGKSSRLLSRRDSPQYTAASLLSL